MSHNKVINILQGSGDSKALMLILAAESAISAMVGPIERNESIIGNIYCKTTILIELLA